MQYYITLIQDNQTASLSTLNCWNLGKSIIKPSVLETKQAHLLWDSPTARIANIPAISFLCNVPPFWPHFQYRISHISFPSPFFSCCTMRFTEGGLKLSRSELSCDPADHDNRILFYLCEHKRCLRGCPRPAETYVLLAMKPCLVTIRPERALLQTKAEMGKE